MKRSRIVLGVLVFAAIFMVLAAPATATENMMFLDLDNSVSDGTFMIQTASRTFRVLTPQVQAGWRLVLVLLPPVPPLVQGFSGSVLR